MFELSVEKIYKPGLIITCLLEVSNIELTQTLVIPIDEDQADELVAMGARLIKRHQP